MEYEELDMQHRHKNGLSPVLTFIIGIAIMVVLIVGLIFAGVLRIKGNDSAGGAKIEGAGYDSPEEAAAAYVEALKEQNLDKMISTFAVESFCDNNDIALRIKKVGYINNAMQTNYPTDTAGSEFLKERNYEAWRGKIVHAINLQMLKLKSYLTGDDRLDYQALQILYLYHTTGQEVDQIVSELASISDLSDLKIEDFVYTEDVNSFFYNHGYWDLLKMLADVYGADGYKPVGVSFTLDDRKYLVTMDMVKHHDKWYIARLYGCLGQYANMKLTSEGIAAYDDEDEFNPEFGPTHSGIDMTKLKAIYNDAHQKYLDQLVELKAAGISENQLDAYYAQRNTEELYVEDIRQSIGAFETFEDFVKFFSLTE